jgi:hypothetical protein
MLAKRRCHTDEVEGLALRIETGRKQVAAIDQEFAICDPVMGGPGDIGKTELLWASCTAPIQGVPIIVPLVNDSVDVAPVASLARPGDDVTGRSTSFVAMRTKSSQPE